MNNTKPYGPYMLVDRLVHMSAVSVQSLGEGKGEFREEGNFPVNACNLVFLSPVCLLTTKIFT